MSGSVTLESLEDRLRVEFIDDARDRLTALYRLLEVVAAKERPEPEAITRVYTEASNLMGTGTAFGFPAVSLVAHRLQDYFNGLPQLGERERADTLVFLDRIAELVDRREQPALAETNRIIRALPTRYVFEVADVEVKDVEVMVVTPSKVVAKKVATELAACGFRPVGVQEPIEAFGMAIRVPPDMVIASVVMEGLSGIDLIRALQAASPTRNIPMALLTSLDRGDPRLREVPDTVAIVRLGSHFSDDLAAAITRFNLG